MVTRFILLIALLCAIPFAEASYQPATTIMDSTGTNTAAVKPASTAPVATDPALVVGISPNSTCAVTGTFWQTTQPVSSTQLPAALDGSGYLKTHEQGTAATSVADGSNVTQGAKADSAATDSTSSWSVVSILKGLWAKLSTINTTLGTPFQAGGALGTGSNVIGKVGIDQTTPGTTNRVAANVDQVAGSAIATGHGTAAGAIRVELPTDGTGVVNAAQSGTWNITNISGTVSLPTGAATSALQTTANTSLSTIATNTGKAPISTTGSGSAAAATVSTVITLSAPANAVGFVLQNLDTSTANVRWSVGRTATTTLGQQLQPGRDTGFIPVGASVSLVAESGTQNYDIQWVSQ